MSKGRSRPRRRPRRASTPGADRVDHAGTVRSADVRERRRSRHPARDPEVEMVERGCAQRDPHLTVPGLGRGHLTQLVGAGSRRVAQQPGSHQGHGRWYVRWRRGACCRPERPRHPGKERLDERTRNRRPANEGWDTSRSRRVITARSRWSCGARRGCSARWSRTRRSNPAPVSIGDSWAGRPHPSSEAETHVDERPMRRAARR